MESEDAKIKSGLWSVWKEIIDIQHIISLKILSPMYPINAGPRLAYSSPRSFIFLLKFASLVM